MKKTTKPDVYLKRASEVLAACKESGVWAKVNVLWYPGETRETIAATVSWLEEHRRFIKGLSVGPTILYRYGQSSRTLLAEFEQLGAAAIDGTSLDVNGYAHLNLSNELSHSTAMSISSELAKSFMDSRAYFDLKGFSYFPRGFSWNEFQNLAEGVADTELPFST